MLKITPNLRIQALTREQLIAITELFGVNKRNSPFSESLASLTNIAMQTKYADLSNERLRQDKVGEKVWGIAPKEGIRIDYSIKPTQSDRVRARAVVGHEAVHMLGGKKAGMVGNNELLSANAVGEYLLKLEKIADASIHSVAVSNRTQKMIEQATLVGQYESAIARHGSLRAAEYEPTVGGKSFAYLGRALGALALRVEFEIGTPGIGLFVIRDVAKGQEIRTAINAARLGKYNRELTVWLGRHPQVRLFILKTAHPKTYSEYVRNIRPKLARKKRPVRPRKKREIIRIHRK